MSILDQDISVNQSSKKSAENAYMNPLKLASALLFTFGYHYLFSTHDARTFQSNAILTYLPYIVGFLFGAFVASIPGQLKNASVTGLLVLLFATYLPLVTTALNGWPLSLLFNIGFGMSACALITRLVINTAYLGRKQQLVLLTTTGVGYLSSIFSAIVSSGSVYNETGYLIIGGLFIMATLVCVAVDTEPELTPMRFSDYFSEKPQFVLTVLLPFVLVGIVASWLDAQCDHFYGRYLVFHDNGRVIATFLISAAAMGLFVLLIKQTNNLNHFVVIGIGAGIKLLIFLFCLTKPEAGDYEWAIGSLNWLSSSVLWFGFDLWIYRYASFPGLAFLFAAYYIVHYMASIIDHYVNIGNRFEYYNF
ncbi:MAG TPA: hypothetical protein VK177_15500 [Flavobacteriales bacterium]|nr:hypothetical protein [Flavobacteriales bacterium]